MAEWQTCYEGCRCSECRQRRSDYFYMINYRASRSIEYDQPVDSEYTRLNNAMDNLVYNNDAKKALRKKYLFE